MRITNTKNKLIQETLIYNILKNNNKYQFEYKIYKEIYERINKEYIELLSKSVTKEITIEERIMQAEKILLDIDTIKNTLYKDIGIIETQYIYEDLFKDFYEEIKEDTETLIK